MREFESRPDRTFFFWQGYKLTTFQAASQNRSARRRPASARRRSVGCGLVVVVLVAFWQDGVGMVVAMVVVMVVVVVGVEVVLIGVCVVAGAGEAGGGGGGSEAACRMKPGVCWVKSVTQKPTPCLTSACLRTSHGSGIDMHAARRGHVALQSGGVCQHWCLGTIPASSFH